MLFVHEVHTVHGAAEDAFERLYRDGWMTHGTGPAYTVVTVTGVRDAAAWGRLCDRVHDGDLRRWASAVDGVRHDVSSRILRPVSWSPLQDIDLADVPVEPLDHDVVLFMEDALELRDQWESRLLRCPAWSPLA